MKSNHAAVQCELIMENFCRRLDGMIRSLHTAPGVVRCCVSYTARRTRIPRGSQCLHSHSTHDGGAATSEKGIAARCHRDLQEMDVSRARHAQICRNEMCGKKYLYDIKTENRASRPRRGQPSTQGLVRRAIGATFASNNGPSCRLIPLAGLVWTSAPR
jgi:hypothetical protein